MVYVVVFATDKTDDNNTEADNVGYRLKPSPDIEADVDLTTV